jgi:hypothetical protein
MKQAASKFIVSLFYFSILKMEVAGSSETSENYLTAWCQVSEGCAVVLFVFTP